MLPALVVMFAASAVFGGYSGTDHNIDFSMCDALIPSWGECLTIGPHNAYFLHYCLNNGFINLMSTPALIKHLAVVENSIPGTLSPHISVPSVDETVTISAYHNNSRYFQCGLKGTFPETGLPRYACGFHLFDEVEELEINLQVAYRENYILHQIYNVSILNGSNTKLKKIVFGTLEDENLLPDVGATRSDMISILNDTLHELPLSDEICVEAKEYIFHYYSGLKSDILNDTNIDTTTLDSLGFPYCTPKGVEDDSADPNESSDSDSNLDTIEMVAIGLGAVVVVLVGLLVYTCNTLQKKGTPSRPRLSKPLGYLSF